MNITKQFIKDSLEKLFKNYKFINLKFRDDEIQKNCKQLYAKCDNISTSDRILYLTFGIDINDVVLKFLTIELTKELVHKIIDGFKCGTEQITLNSLVNLKDIIKDEISNNVYKNTVIIMDGSIINESVLDQLDIQDNYFTNFDSRLDIIEYNTLLGARVYTTSNFKDSDILYVNYDNEIELTITNIVVEENTNGITIRIWYTINDRSNTKIFSYEEKQ